jgi:hypothetical protein
MSSRSNDPITGVTAEAIEAFRRVKISAGGRTLAYADAADGANYAGTSEAYAASGDHLAVKMAGQNGTHKCVAAGVITALALLYAADDGKVSATANGKPIGYAIEAAGADGDIIESVLFTTTAAAALVCTNITAAGASDAPTVVTLAQLRGGIITQSYAGASFIELATPSTADKGMCVELIKLGAAGALTISTAGAELVAGGATLATINAVNEGVVLYWSGTAWSVIKSTLYPVIQRPAMLATNISAAGTAQAPTVVTLAQLRGGIITQSYAGASYIELATPEADDAGMAVRVIKLGSAGAVTITTEGAELIAGGASLATIDAENDRATLYWSGTAWTVIESTIA